MKRLTLLLALLLLLTACAHKAPEEPDTPQPPASDSQAQDEAEAPPPSPVYTDWSKLTPYAGSGAQYTYYTPRSPDGLFRPQSNYGTLLTYVGAIAELDNYILEKMPLYGLVTADGQVVTEPVYANIRFQGPFLVLYKGESAGYVETEWGPELRGSFAYTAAAADGSWAYELGACYDTICFGDYLAAAELNGTVTILHADGSLAARYTREQLTPYLGADYQWNWDGGAVLTVDNGVLTIWQYRDDITDGNYNVCYFDVAAGAVSAQPPKGWAPYDYSTAPQTPHTEPPNASDYTYLEPITDEVTGKTYYYGSRVTEDMLHYDLLDAQGRVVGQDCGAAEFYIFEPFVRAGLFSSIEEDAFTYRSIDSGELVFRYPLHSNLD